MTDDYKWLPVIGAVSGRSGVIYQLSTVDFHLGKDLEGSLSGRCVLFDRPDFYIL